MRRTLIVGAGVLLGWVLACGGKIGVDGDRPVPTSTSTGVRPPPPRPPPTDDPPPDPPPPGGSCPTTQPVASSDLPYEAAATPQVGACTEQELSALVAAVPTAQSDDDLKKPLSAKCASCIFTDVNKPPWGPLPETPTGGGAQAVTINQGGCYQLVTGSQACGKAVQNALDCTFYACADCPDNNAYYKCQTSAAKSACKDIVAGEEKACGAVDPTLLQTADTKCGAGAGAQYGFEGVIRVMCITGP